MDWKHKVVWVFILGWFAIIELKSIDIERRDHEREFNATVDRLETLFREVQRVEKLVGRVPPPSMKVPHTPVARAPVAPIYFDSTAIFLKILKGPSVFQPGIPVEINFVYSNHSTRGEIAHHVIADGVIEVWPGGTSSLMWENREFAKLKSRMDHAQNRMIAVDVLPANGNFFTRVSDTLTPDQAQALQDGKQRLYVFGIIRWSDSTGPHESQICSSLQPPGTAPIWNNCISGHNTIQ